MPKRNPLVINAQAVVTELGNMRFAEEFGTLRWTVLTVAIRLAKNRAKYTKRWGKQIHIRNDEV